MKNKFNILTIKQDYPNNLFIPNSCIRHGRYFKWRKLNNIDFGIMLRKYERYE